jgi:membrane protein DedA with SNARE-associated domain
METGQEIIRQVGAMSYLGIFFLSFMANIIVPVPEEIVILAIGYVAGVGIINFWITLPVVIAGAFVSDLGMFWLSRHDNKIVKGFYTRVFSKVFPIDHDFLARHSEKVIFCSRFLVQLRFLGPFIAGQVRVSWKKFIIYDLIALLVYIPVLMWAGHYFAIRIDSIFDGVNQVKNVVIIVAVIFVIWSLGKLIRDFFMRIIKKKSQQ